MPARCWIAPEMPEAMYSCGETVLPVWPTWLVCGYQPASTAAREAPTAAPSESASSSTIAKFSAVDATAAGDHDRGLGQLGTAGRLARRAGGDLGAGGRVAERDTEAPPRRRRPERPPPATEFGLTVMTGVPLVTRDLVVKEAANADCVADRALVTGLQVDGVGDDAGADPDREAGRDLLALGGGRDSTAAGVTWPRRSWASASTFGTTR